MREIGGKHPGAGMERVASRTVYEGEITAVRIEEFRFADGSSSEREVVAHPGAVTVIPYDEEFVWLVRQPREAVGEEDLLELPAGKLDVEGESPLECAQRELTEEIGKQAGEWREIRRFYISPGLTEEEMWLYTATELADVDHEPDPHERIEVVPWPLDRLDDAIAKCRDSKSLVGLFELRALLGG